MEFWQRRNAWVNIRGMLLFIAGVWCLLQLVTPIVSVAGLSEYQPTVSYAVVLAITLLIARLHDDMPAAWVGLPVSAEGFGSGLALGGVMAIVAWLPVAIIAVAKGGELVLYEGGQNIGAWCVALLLIAIYAAGEEILFRGYLFQRLLELVGPAITVLVSSILFAAAHAGNPSVTTGALLNIVLGGIFFSLCYLRTGSLWVPIGAHIAWNMVLAKIFGLPVSGKSFGDALIATPIPFPDIITGGAFGPEGGFAATLPLLAGIALVAGHRWFDYSPWIYASVFRAWEKVNGGKVNGGKVNRG